MLLLYIILVAVRTTSVVVAFTPNGDPEMDTGGLFMLFKYDETRASALSKISEPVCCCVEVVVIMGPSKVSADENALFTPEKTFDTERPSANLYNPLNNPLFLATSFG